MSPNRRPTSAPVRHESGGSAGGPPAGGGSGGFSIAGGTTVGGAPLSRRGAGRMSRFYAPPAPVAIDGRKSSSVRRPLVPKIKEMGLMFINARLGRFLA